MPAWRKRPRPHRRRDNVRSISVAREDDADDVKRAGRRRGERRRRDQGIARCRAHRRRNYGLSYTSFTYATLHVASAAGNQSGAPRYTASFDVTNSSKRAGADVAEVDVGEQQARVPRPAKALKGFARVTLEPGETTHVGVPLDTRAFAYWDTMANTWTVDSASFDVLVGRASDDIVLKASIDVK